MSIKERIVEVIDGKSCMTLKKISHLVSLPRSVVRTLLQELIENNQIVKYPSNSKRYKRGREIYGRTLYALSSQVLHPLCKEDESDPYCDECKLASRDKDKCLKGNTCLVQTGGNEWYCKECPNKWSDFPR